MCPAPEEIPRKQLLFPEVKFKPEFEPMHITPPPEVKAFPAKPPKRILYVPVEPFLPTFEPMAAPLFPIYELQPTTTAEFDNAIEFAPTHTESPEVTALLKLILELYPTATELESVVFVGQDEEPMNVLPEPVVIALPD